MRKAYNYCFAKKKKSKITYNNFSLGIFIIAFLILMIPVMWCIGIITLYVVDRGYDFKTGDCDSGIFCNSGSAYCSSNNDVYLTLGCTAFGIMTTAFISVGVIVLVISIFFLFKTSQHLFKCCKKKKNQSQEDTNENV
jgi:hypothetical protein